jgi:BCD family chlorophyll transporter-like MFS transporter
MAFSGTLRDLVNGVLGTYPGPWGLPGVANGYLAVYGLEMALLLVTIAATLPLVRPYLARGIGLTRQELGTDAEPAAPRPVKSPATPTS